MKFQESVKYFLALLLVTSSFGYASSSATINPEYISIPEGLASAFVKNILQDSYGMLWIGTENGLHKYDGYSFTRYKNIPGETTSLLNDDVWGLAEDKQMNIWVANENGVSKFDRNRNAFINYDLQETFELESSNGGRVFNLLIDSKDRKWAAALNLNVLLYDQESDSWNQVSMLVGDSVQSENIRGIVLGICEDNEGKIWVGTDLGIYYYNELDSMLVPLQIEEGFSVNFTHLENRITALYWDLTNTLWITARNGIYKYYPQNNSLKKIIEYDYAKLPIWNHWNAIAQDISGNIWIGNNYRGILKFDGVSDEFTEVKLVDRLKNQDGSSEVTITHLIKDKTGIIWFGSLTHGIIKYDPSREPFNYYTSIVNDKNSLTSNQIFSLFESQVRPNKIYVGTRGGGLNLFDRLDKTFSPIPFEVKTDAFGGSVRSVYEESDGSVWLGTWGDGLIYMNSNYREIKRFRRDSLSVNSLSDNSIRLIKKYSDDEYWIGTNRGLNVLNPKTNKIKRIGSIQNRVYSQELYDRAFELIKSSEAKSISQVTDYEDRSLEFQVIKPRKYLVVSMGEGTSIDNQMYDFGWVTNSKNDTIWTMSEYDKTFYVGGAIKNRIHIDIIDLRPGKYKLRYKSDDSHSYKNWNADKPKYPQYWGIHIAKLEDEKIIENTQKYISESINKFLITGNNIRSIHLHDDIVWIGTDQFGLNKLNRETGEVIVYSYNEENSNSLSNNSVQFIHEDDDGFLWLATNAGLNKFDPVKETFIVYTEEDGLPTNYIASILPGNSNELWLATRSGISKLVSHEETGRVTFVNYDIEDGLGGMDFIALVALKTNDGQFYFGGEHGLNSFTPGESNTSEPDLIFSDIKLSNKSLNSFADGESILQKSLYETDNIELSHDQNDLTFEFAALHFSKPNKNQYAYKLIGYDDDWIYNNKREATYTNLDPGNYTFSFKGSNRDGVWSSESRQIDIVINPPWWFTTWAYIGYGLLLIAGVFAVDRIQRRRLMSKMREKRRIEEAELRAETAELQARASEAERKVLESEYSQKKKELEEARELQLSMLPKELPQLPHLDIAVYMKTATEVGGDYYDFHIGMDGTLTVVLGDATGHGMKAGTMVTTTKSLFNVLAPNPNIVETFHEMTRCLKLMQIEKLSMCMSMMKIIGNKIQMSSAGMPPIFIYKRESQSIEEHLIKGMPLGTFTEFPYSLIESSIDSGDTILMMSDGLPELINEDKEMFGYKKARNLFEELAGNPPEEIISKLKEAGSDWINDNEPDDDVTFVVIKVK